MFQITFDKKILSKYPPIKIPSLFIHIYLEKYIFFDQKKKKSLLLKKNKLLYYIVFCLLTHQMIFVLNMPDIFLVYKR